GPDGNKGSWSTGEDRIDYLMDPKPLGGPGSAPKPDPQLYATYAGNGSAHGPDGEADLADGDVETFYADGRWKNQVVGNSRASSTGDTKAEAQAEGRELARKRGATHVVRRKDGEIAERHDYGR
ncbi:DUF2188 domain-containing protein, partial [Amycolatopsis ruanii]